MNRRRGVVYRPTAEGYARVAKTSRPWHDHAGQPALDHVEFAAIPRSSCSISLRGELPARSMASYNFHRLAVRDSVRGSSNPVLKRTAAGAGVPVSLGLAAA